MAPQKATASGSRCAALAALQLLALGLRPGLAAAGAVAKAHSSKRGGHHRGHRRGLTALQVDAAGRLSEPDHADGGAEAHVLVRREPRGQRHHSHPGASHRAVEGGRSEALLAISNGSMQDKLACHTAAYAPRQGCPESCPYAAQDTEAPCYFYCVVASECGQFPVMPGEDVPDAATKTCKRCQMEGCQRCSKDGLATCDECKPGFAARGGQCVSTGGVSPLVVIACVICSLGMLLLLWYLDLRCRRRVYDEEGNLRENTEVLKFALEHRDQLKICDEERDGRPPLPLWDTSVHKNIRAGGPGFLLHMDFQLMLLGWMLAGLLGWLLFSVVVGPEVWSIGLGESTTSLQLCHSIHHGRAMRDRILQGKATFVGLFYVGSVAVFLAFAARQQRKFADLDDQEDTLVDYAVRCEGFPREDGHEGLEKEYEQFFKDLGEQHFKDSGGGEAIVGVSICWDRFSEGAAEDLAKLIERIEEQRELAPGTSGLVPQGPDQPPTIFASLEAALGLDAALKVGELPPVQEPVQQVSEAELLSKVKTTGECFVVCQTQDARAALLKALEKEDAPRFRANPADPASGKLTAWAAMSEPSAVRWEAHGYFSRSPIHRKLLGCAAIFGGALLWAFLFYLPYAYYTYQTFAETGHDVSNSASLVFTLLVIVGNQVMYQVCGVVAEMVQPQLNDEKETFYMVSYTVATLLNMALDIGVLIFTTYFGMVVRKVRNDEGVLLSELGSAEAVLESYPMQKFGGHMLYMYNVWGCFIVPFLFEPVFAVYLPYHLGCLLVRSRKVPFKQAVSVTMCFPIDMGRYADLVMNATLCVCALFCASGYVWMNMAALLVGNAFIYVYDRVRALRYVDWFHFSTNFVDVNAQRLLALPCAALAACLVFQLRLMRALGLSDGWTLPLVTLAFLVHVIVHVGLLELVMKASKPERQAISQRATYQEVAQCHRVDWFTCNKVHCLRTQFLLKDTEKLEWLAPCEVRAHQHKDAGPPADHAAADSPATDAAAAGAKGDAAAGAAAQAAALGQDDSAAGGSGGTGASDDGQATAAVDLASAVPAGDAAEEGVL